jgi:proteasome accessory factor A
MSEYTNFVKVGACAVVLQMIEDNFINQDFTLRNPVKAIKDISYDTTCKRKLRLDNGREYSPIEIQLRVLRDGAQVHRAVPGLRRAARLRSRSGSTCSTASTRDPTSSAARSTGIIKRQLIESYIQSKRTGWNDPRVFMLDLQYHDIRVNRGLYYLLERKGARRARS